jgi:hypothetical protein
VLQPLRSGAKRGAEAQAKIDAAYAAREAERQRRAEADAINPASKMKLSTFSWSLGGFKSVGLVNATVDNPNDFPVKDVTIQCRFSGKSGTQLSNAGRTVYDTVPAHSKKTFREINVGFVDTQSARAECWVEAAKHL